MLVHVLFSCRVDCTVGNSEVTSIRKRRDIKVVDRIVDGARGSLSWHCSDSPAVSDG